MKWPNELELELTFVISTNELEEAAEKKDPF